VRERLYQVEGRLDVELNPDAALRITIWFPSGAARAAGVSALEPRAAE
jgi:hypothetical protein